MAEDETINVVVKDQGGKEVRHLGVRAEGFAHYPPVLPFPRCTWHSSCPTLSSARSPLTLSPTSSFL